MTMHHLASFLLVSATFCLAVAIGLGASFYIVMSMVAVVLAGQYYAAAVRQEDPRGSARRR